MTTRRPHAVRALAAGALLALSACDAPGAHAGTPAPPAVPANALRAESPAAPAMKGSFVVAYPAPEDPAYELLQDEMRASAFLEETAAWLNGWIALPEDVTLAFESCGQPNAFYDPETRGVALCYELLEELDRIFADAGSEEEIAQAAADALLFTTLHEVGHALVDLLDLPVTGREEDAVDQLAALILVDGSEEGNHAAVNGIIALSSDEEEMDETAFADEHGLGEQRFYNVVCLVYGQDPEANGGWVDEGWLPETRAELCPAEYEQVARSWDRLLERYLKE